MSFVTPNICSAVLDIINRYGKFKTVNGGLKNYIKLYTYIFNKSGEFPGKPVVRNLLPYCQGSGIKL